MPRITLKPNSPEFLDSKKVESSPHVCDMPGCNLPGDCRAPKSRDLNSYYHFCQTHAAEYNRAWNFFSDMSDNEMQRHYQDHLYGHRPTWKYGVGTEDEMEELQRKTWQFYHYTNKEPPRAERYRKTSDRFVQQNTPEADALSILGLEPPITLVDIKVRYKELAKLYHPDLNEGCREAENKLKSVNMAYTILKVAYEKYETLVAQS